MPVFKFFLTVGTVLTSALFALNAYLEPVSSTSGARVSVAPTTASLFMPALPLKKPK